MRKFGIRKKIRKAFSKHKNFNRAVLLLIRRHRASWGGYPKWQKILKGGLPEEIIKEKSLIDRPKILIGTSVGAYLPGVTLESLLGVALKLRGAEVHVLLCDSVLPACLDCHVSVYPDQNYFIKNGPSKDLCKYCFEPANEMYSDLGFKVHRYSDYLTDYQKKTAEEISSDLPIDQIGKYQYSGIKVGEHALSGALRFYARSSLEEEACSEAILRRYLKAALMTLFVTKTLLFKEKFKSILFHHGIYIPQGIIGEVARQEKIGVVNWNPAYRKRCFIFSHDDTYHHTLILEPVEKWENIALTEKKEKKLMRYLRSRWHDGSDDWIWFHDKPNFDLKNISKEVGVDFTKPCIGMLTNVLWDAQLHYPNNAFKNMLEWVVETIRYFSKRTELQLLIRIHPAETSGAIPSRQTIMEEITICFPILPSNVFIISSESQISTFAAMSECDSVIIYGTKTGVELSAVGIPIIVAGEAWIRNKGITFDASSLETYISLLDQLPLKERLDKEAVKRARKYAYHFFFRRMIPIEAIKPVIGNPPYQVSIKNVDELAPGRCAGLDTICDGILHGSDFIC